VSASAGGGGAATAPGARRSSPCSAAAVSRSGNLKFVTPVAFQAIAQTPAAVSKTW